MSRLECMKSSDLDVHALRSHESHQAITTLLHLVSSCAGPYGKNQIIRNACGGHMTITSSSARLLSAMMISRNELKIIVSATLSHVKQYRDGGLFMTYIVLRLMKSCITITMDIPHFTVSTLFHTFISIVSSYLSSDKCEVGVKVDFSNVQVLLAYVRSVLTSKTLLNLDKTDCDNLSRLVVETFVGAVPSVMGKRFSDGMFLIGVENQPVNASKVLEGLLLACPEISHYDEDMGQLHLKVCTETSSNGKTISYIKTLLVKCSMSGDVEDMLKAKFEATEQQFNDVDTAVMQKMNALCTIMESENVGIVLCQKVIHPHIKTVLKSHGIFFLDRLGSQVIPYLQDLTGCIPLLSIMTDTSSLLKCWGKLLSVKHHIKGGCSYLLLNNGDANVNSLIVCGEWEERVSELKSCVNSCFQGLSLLAKEPKFLMGGGCWQMNCSAVLEKQVIADLPKILEELSCSQVELQQTLSLFVSSLRGWCHRLKSEQEHLTFDPSSGHAWRVPKGMTNSICEDEVLHCCCGFKSVSSHRLQDMDIVLDCASSFDPAIASAIASEALRAHVEDICDYDGVVLDSFSVSMQVLNKAALTVGMLLSVGHFITDRN